MAIGAWYVRALAAFGAVCALVPALAMWNFTVDDALISIRYAHHLASGLGYRFNPLGPVTDGVTPLPWAPLLAVLHGSDLLATLVRAKMLGLVAWTTAAGALGASVARRADTKGFAVVALAIVGLAFPLGAWAVSGMETGLALALATGAAIASGRPRLAALLAGVAAMLRPELVVWAMIVGAGYALAAAERGREARAAALAVAIAFAPFAVCAALRLVMFGHAAPLALSAKPSDLAHGARYAAAAVVAVLTPILGFAPLMAWRAPARAKVLVLAGVAHVLVVVAVGGDWMPYARLLVPIAPSLVLVYVEPVAGRGAQVSRVVRALVAIALGILVAGSAAPAGRRVGSDRNDLILRARPVLAGARVVAALDIGWVGAATGATIVDLAGLTDPTIAVLSGGHTSKAVDTAMLLERDVDTVLVYSASRWVEQRITRSELFARRYEHVLDLPLGDQGAAYGVYRRR